MSLLASTGVKDAVRAAEYGGSMADRTWGRWDRREGEEGMDGLRPKCYSFASGVCRVLSRNVFWGGKMVQRSAF